MRIGRWNGYEGTCTFCMGGVWRVSISRRQGRGTDWRQLDAALLLDNLDLLRGKLQLADVMAVSVKLDDMGQRCEIKTARQKGYTRTEGRQIVQVLQQLYPAHEDTPIRWRWGVRQYN